MRRKFTWNIFLRKKEAKSLIIHCGAVSDRTTDSSQASHCMCGIHVMTRNINFLLDCRVSDTEDSESVNWNLSISWIELILFDMSLTTNYHSQNKQYISMVNDM